MTAHTSDERLAAIETNIGHILSAVSEMRADIKGSAETYISRLTFDTIYDSARREIEAAHKAIRDEDGKPTAFERVIDAGEHAAGTKKRSRWHTGLIAQELKKTLDEIGEDLGAYQDTAVNAGGDVKGIGYTELIAILIKGLQEADSRITLLENEIREMKAGR